MLSLRARKALLATAVAVTLPLIGAVLAVPGGASAATPLAAAPPPELSAPTPTPTVVCPPDNGDCQGSIGVPGGPPGGGGGGGDPGGGGKPVCTHNGTEVPCFLSQFGYYNQFDDCYYLLESPQPPTGDPSRDGHPQGDGNVYIRTCLGASGPGGPANNSVLVWLPDPPPGQPGAPTDAQRAESAIGLLKLRGPLTHTTPTADRPGQPGTGGVGLIGLPTWLWTSVDLDADGGIHWVPAGSPATVTIAIPGDSLTLVATFVSISYDMGDGRTVTCDGPGVAYDPTKAGIRPPCGHVYQRPGDYTVTGTTTWHVTWSATDGQSGVITPDVQRQGVPVTLHIRQAEVVTR